MLEPQQVESLVSIVATMDRDDIVERLMHFQADFPVDFTPSYLDQLSTDRLRHIFVAVCLQAGQLPAETMASAA